MELQVFIYVMAAIIGKTGYTIIVPRFYREYIGSSSNSATAACLKAAGDHHLRFKTQAVNKSKNVTVCFVPDEELVFFHKCIHCIKH